MNKAKIIGLGGFVPEERITNEDLAKIVDTSDEWIVTRTGIKERRRAAADMPTSQMATAAARNALKDAGLEPTDLDMILVATATGDYSFPATACLVSRDLGAGTAPALDITAACSGFVYGTSIAAQYVNTGAMKNILVIGAEQLTKITDWTDRGTCVLFGDGAGAAVISSEGEGHEITDSILRSYPEQWDALMRVGGGVAVTGERSDRFIQLRGREVFKIAVGRMTEVLAETCERNGFDPSEIDVFIPHQMNLRIMTACAERFGIPMDKVVMNIERYGNTSAASIPIALEEASRNGRLKKGDRVVLVAFGGGFTWGTNVIRW